MTTIFWPEFGILFIAAILGSIAIMPYSLRLLKGSGKPLKLSIPTLLFLSLLQNAILFAVVVGIGLLAAHAIDLGAPHLEAVLIGSVPAHSFAATLGTAIIFGIIVGAILLIADLFFLPYFPEKLLTTALETTTVENFTASFYGGINEELLMRLFGFSILVWIFSRIWHTPAGLPTSAVLWTVNIVMAIIFGIGHVPALKNLIGQLSRKMLARTLLLNFPVGLMCGWLFWTYGIEAAIITHFSADIIYHVFGTLVLRKLQNKTE